MLYILSLVEIMASHKTSLVQAYRGGQGLPRYNYNLFKKNIVAVLYIHEVGAIT